MTQIIDAQSALGFVMPAFYNVERTVYKRKYPSFDYASLIPVVTEGNEWARGTLFRSSDAAGQAARSASGEYTVLDKGRGWFVIMQDGREVTKSVREDAVKDFDGLSDEDKAAFVAANKAA